MKTPAVSTFVMLNGHLPVVPPRDPEDIAKLMEKKRGPLFPLTFKGHSPVGRYSRQEVPETTTEPSTKINYLA